MNKQELQIELKALELEYSTCKYDREMHLQTVLFLESKNSEFSIMGNKLIGECGMDEEVPENMLEQWNDLIKKIEMLGGRLQCEYNLIKTTMEKLSKLEIRIQHIKELLEKK